MRRIRLSALITFVVFAVLAGTGLTVVTGGAGPVARVERCPDDAPIRCMDSLDATALGTPVRKGSDLSWPLQALADAQRELPPSAEAISAANLSALPKSVGDMVATDLMEIDDAGRVQVFVETSTSVVDALPTLKAVDAKIDRTDDDLGLIQAWVAAADIEALAAAPGVERLRLPDYGSPLIGSVTTQGDALLSAATTRSTFGVDGSGQSVGVVSDGVQGILMSQASGDLPAVNTATCDVGPGNPNSVGSGAEGTAMLEIVHDMAPGADLWFGHPGFGFGGTVLDFMAAVNCLAQNVDIVVDDIGFFNAGPYDGTSAVSMNATNALNNGSNPIRGYYNAVGNQALGHYQGGFVNSGFDITGQGGTPVWDMHRFQANILTTDGGVGLPCDAGSPAFCGDTLLLAPGGSLVVLLQWNDPFGGSGNDYDLFLVNETAGQLFLASGDVQNGNDDPTEAFAWTNNTGGAQLLDIVIGRFSGSPRTFDMFVNCDGCVPVPNGVFGEPIHNFNTRCSSVPNNSDAGGGVVSLGAIDAADPGTNTIEPYSSCGPTDDGRIKPDGTGVDGVSVTGNGGFPSTFFGTSASAPHAAGIAALVLDCNKSLSRDGLRNALLDNAVDLGTAGIDNIFGSGRLSTLNSANAVTCGPPPTPTSTPTNTPTPTITPTPTPKNPDGDTDGDTVVNSADLDDDGDGCLDTQEIGVDAALGGRRNPHHFWDVFDTPDALNVRDGIMSTGDILRIVLRFGTNGDPGGDPLSAPPASGYHTAFDRSPPVPGGEPWDLNPADGAIAANDILFLVNQFGHSCAT